MASSAAVRDSRGFTTDHFGRCCLCFRDIPVNHATCACGAIIEHVRLQPKQRQILDWVLAEGPQVPTKLGFGGSRAAGKSRGAGRDVALIVASEVAQKYPGITISIMRRNWTQCKENHLEKFQLERPRLGSYYGDKQYAFPRAMGGARIIFSYADTSDDVIRMERGPEFFLMIPDQAEQISEMDLQKLNTPNRWPDAGPNAAKTLYLFNPGGAGSAYLKRVFFDKEYRDNEDPGDFAFVQAYGWDNASWFLNEGIEIDGKPLTWERFYECPGEIPEPAKGQKYDREWMMSLPENHRFRLFVTQTSEGRKMWRKPESIRMGDLFGRFDQFSGQFFAGVWDRNRVVMR